MAKRPVTPGAVNPFAPSSAYMDWLAEQAYPDPARRGRPTKERGPDHRTPLECSAAVPRWLAPPVRKVSTGD